MIVSVVGSGSKCIGYGEEIDSSDYVVRLADCHWQTKEDHGTKYDIGVLRDANINWLHLDEAMEKGELRVPVFGWWVYRHILIREIYLFQGLPVRTIILDDIEIKTKLTRGAAAVVAAIKYLEPTELWLYGFDSLVEGKLTGYHKNFKSKGTKFKAYKGKPRTKTHVWANDWDLIKKLAKNIKLYHYGKRI